jgi:catechol 1,2-dioxygenase
MKRVIIILAVLSAFWGIGFSEAGKNGVCTPTQNDVEGPYYVPGTPFRNWIAEPDEPGDRIIIRGSVFHTDCTTPVKEALIEVWQTDAGGEYHYKDEEYRLRGQMRADKNGYYEFSSIKPGRYRIMNGFRPAHIHMKVSHPDYETLITQLYFKGDPFLWPKDACGGGCKSNDPRRIIPLNKNREGLEGTFSIILRPVQK